jgi:hypothetical protein
VDLAETIQSAAEMQSLPSTWKYRVTRLNLVQQRRALPDPGHRTGRVTAPPAQRFHPPGETGLAVGGYVPPAAVSRRAVGAAFQLADWPTADPHLFCAELPRAGRLPPVTLSYPKSGPQLRELLYAWCLMLGRPHRPGLLRAPQKPTTPRHGGRSPQESHGLNGTLRYTCYAC